MEKDQKDFKVAYYSVDWIITKLNNAIMFYVVDI